MRFLLFQILLLLLPAMCDAQNVALKQAINDLKSDPYMKEGRWGVAVMNCSTGSMAEAYQEDSMFIPASVVKLLSSAAVLNSAGPDYRFETRIWINGSVDQNGVLNGDVWIEGGGDPTIGATWYSDLAFIDSLKNALQRQGIERIQGHFYGLSVCFDSVLIPETYPADDYGNYYGAGTSGLIWDGNRMTLTFNTPGTPGSATTLKSYFPPFDQFSLDNKTTSGRSGTGDNSIVYGGPFEFERSIEGSLPPGKTDFKVYGSTPDPALGFVLATRYHLEKKGIFASGNCYSRYSGKVPETSIMIMKWRSAPISDIMKYSNTNSHNVTAETLLKTAGMVSSGIGTYATGLEQVNSLLDSLGIPLGQMELFDGCGLSKKNSVSPGAMCTFLMQARLQTWFPVLWESLPVAGQTGTLSSMFQGTNVHGKLRAKSGYMKTVRAYAGYVENQQGQMMVFCVIVNHYSGNAFALKKKLENLMIAVSLSE